MCDSCQASDSCKDCYALVHGKQEVSTYFTDKFMSFLMVFTLFMVLLPSVSAISIWNTTSAQNELAIFIPFENNTLLGENNAHIVDISNKGDQQHNATIIGTGQVWPTLDGKFGKGVKSLGITGGVQFNHTGTSDDTYITDNEPFTMSLWIKLNSSQAGRKMVSKRGANGYQFSMIAGGQVQLRIDEGATNYDTSSTGMVQDGQWYHLVAGRNATHHFIFINGQLNASLAQPSTASLASSDPLVLFNLDVFNEQLNGTMDNFCFWERALNAQEVAAFYALPSGSCLGQPFITYNTPTPPDNAINNTQATISMTSTASSLTLWFGNTTLLTDVHRVLNTSNLTASYTTSVTDGVFYYKASADNGYENTTLRTWTYDTTPPVVTAPDVNATANVTSIYTFHAVDDHIYSYNISCSEGTSNVVSGLDVGVLNVNLSLYVNESIVCAYDVCDGHTRARLNTQFSVVQDDASTLRFRPTATREIVLSTMDASLSFSPLILQDRISIAVTDADRTPGTRDYTLRLSTSGNAHYFPASPYPGHIVDGDARLWFDTFGEDTVQVFSPAPGQWDVTITTDKRSFTLNSIGELNCVQGSFTVTPQDPEESPWGWLEIGACPAEGAPFYRYLGLFAILVTLYLLQVRFIRIPILGAGIGSLFVVFGGGLLGCSLWFGFITMFVGLFIMGKELTVNH